MSPAYIDAVTTHLPKARLVFDRFHVIKLYNDKLSELRLAMYRDQNHITTMTPPRVIGCGGRPATGHST